MNIFSSSKRLTGLVLAATSLLSSWALHAQTNTATLQETVVAATRTEQPLVDLVADVTVIDRAQIERSGASGLADVLSRTQGFEMGRNGGPGNSTSLFLRGAETRFTAVFVDGVRVDTQTTSGGAPWESIPLSQIERVEIVRGPVSAVYGSDALGGVVQIFTRKGQGGFTPNVGVGVGTYGTRKWEGGFSGTTDKVDYAFGVAREASGGFNVRPVSGYNDDDDGYSIEAVSARLGWQLDDRHRLEASLLSSNLDAQYDSSATAPASRRDDRSLQLLQTKGLNWRARWSDRYTSQLSLTESRTQSETKPSVSLAMTRLNGYLWQNEFRFGAHQVTASLERRVDYLENGLTVNPRTAIVRDRSQDALALGYGWRAGRHTVQLNARHDQDSEFGGKGTAAAAYGYALNSRLRLNASMGTGFRAPTLYQRFSIYGVSTLKPEESVNQELGLHWTEGSSRWSAVVYRNRVSNLITYSNLARGCTNTSGCYTSTAEAELSGLTLSTAHRLGGVNLQASWDVQSPRDSASGTQLARRAGHHAHLSVDTHLGAWVLGGGAQFSGARYDDAANTLVLPGYSLFHVYVSRRVARDWTVLARIDNLGDASYQLANGYATAGRSLFVSLKWAPL